MAALVLPTNDDVSLLPAVRVLASQMSMPGLLELKRLVDRLVSESMPDKAA
jgi:hypothetical protein